VSRLTRGYIIALPVRGYHPLRPCFPDRFWLSLMYHWPGPRSLATTNGVSIDVLSSRYLDVSVPWVRLKPPMNSEISYLHLITGNPKPRGLVSNIAVRTPRYEILEFQLSKVGFPIRKSVDQSFFAAPHVLHRLSAPRHPPNTLKALDCSHYQCPHTRQNVVCATAIEGTHPR
jgi:hypothetical protein